MPRSRTHKVHEVKARLVTDLRDGSTYRPGERFLSARELAARHGVSYQTAHRLLDELCTEGLVERRAASGTYVPGGTEAGAEPAYAGACLIFSRRAARPNSFGARLLADLAGGLRRAGLHWEVRWEEEGTATVEGAPSDAFPVLWETSRTLAAVRRAGRAALLLNARPEPGLDAALLDSVSVDDYAGGAFAADLLLRAEVLPSSLAVMTGPDGDTRSDARRDGFLSRAAGATVVAARGWYVEDGSVVAGEALEHGTGGVFCVNDRLAEAVLLHARRRGLPRPRLVGFDDAPIAAALGLTTIAIPWAELAADAAEAVRQRVAGDSSAARQRIITPRPVVRSL